MVLNNIGLARGTVTALARRRVLAALACLATLAGCENLADLESGLREKLDNAFGASDTASAPRSGYAREGAQGGEVIVILDRPAAKTLQAQLARRGFRPGPVDGIVGRNTVRAIRRYQAANGLPVTGRVSLQLMEHLEGTSGGRRTPAKAAAKAPVNLASGDFPTYLPGTSFSYSNGDTERIVSTKGSVIRWVRGDGTTFSAYRNFLLPKLYWTSEEERGTARISGDAEDLWPVHEGEEVSFFAKITMQDGDDPDSTRQRNEHWRCRNEGSRTVSVKAGTFETLVFVCRGGETAAAADIVRTWYYAKSVRHYVRFEETVAGIDTTESVDLVAIRPGAPDWPPIMRAALARAVVHALEMKGDDSRMPWTSSGVKAHVTIEAKSRFMAHDGRPCRHFVQIWSEGGRQRHYPAVACKSALGKWAIPGLPNQSVNALATTGRVS